MTGQREPRYWHGGVPDLKPGDFILPVTETGTPHNLTANLAAAGITGLEPDFVRSDRVHLTTDRDAARVYAAAYPDGALYRVEPVGDVEPDPDAPDVAVRCERAVVLAVYDPCVRWAERGTRWLRLLLRERS